MDFLSTDISLSKQKMFSLVTFVDTPELVNGDSHYPFDVNEAILWLANMVCKPNRGGMSGHGMHHQNTLRALEQDCETIMLLIEKRQEQDSVYCSYNFRTYSTVIMLGAKMAILSLHFILDVLVTVPNRTLLHSVLAVSFTDSLLTYFFPVSIM
ncbi:uncharacterized protein LOC111874240 isoform X2 [Cryptotermes secundus]|uniref:uncharacterized protein LOC111874240 isoform X2 n=1 Tax=Cryptotermes secundus TaxID=105785 RepID=UPI000CD7DEFD|nr:uncharacterized protein LOC111874240 isoform X2 [Cryptotermes secundus]